MTRSELIRTLAGRFPELAQKDADEAVATILEAMQGALAAGRRIEIRGFGSFSLNGRAPRTARNPKTGETFITPGKKYPYFRAGKELRECVNQSAPPID